MFRILVIDDEEAILEVLKICFSREGYEVEVALDGDVGMAIHRTRPVDIVLTDILMPHKEGFETIRELRTEFPDLKIIAMSGGGLNESGTYLDLAKAFGADKIFTKPFELSELKEGVQELLAHQGVS